MSPTHEKLLREYGDPRNSMAAKEFRRDLSRLVREVREECAKVAEEHDFENTHASVRLSADIANAIRGRKR